VASGDGANVGSGATTAHDPRLERPRIHDMPLLLAALPLVFAQNAPAPNPNATGNPMTMWPFILVLVFWGYFLFFRPQQKQEKMRREMLAALKKNDKVLTSAGIYGTVVSVDSDQDRVVLRIDDDRGVKVAFSKSAVARVLETSQEKAAETS
jgi:preprotein translocase subunit YajC